MDHWNVAVRWPSGVTLETNFWMLFWAGKELRVLEKTGMRSLTLQLFLGLIEGGLFTSPHRWQSTSSFSVHLGGSSWVMGIHRWHVLRVLLGCCFITRLLLRGNAVTVFLLGMAPAFDAWVFTLGIGVRCMEISDFFPVLYPEITVKNI